MSVTPNEPRSTLPSWAASRWDVLPRLRARAVLETLCVERFEQGHTSTAWAVVDAARNHGAVHALIAQHAALYPDDIQSLFDGQAYHAMARQGPWLVDLRRLHSPLFAEWFDGGWGEAWGIFLATQPTELARVKRHLKKFLVAALESSGREPPKPALYRFYDPRVLRSTLPFFNYDFAEHMFGKVIGSYVCEGARLAQVRGHIAVGELYRYTMPQETFLQKLTGAVDLQTDTFILPDHTRLADQPDAGLRADSTDTPI